MPQSRPFTVAATTAVVAILTTGACSENGDALTIPFDAAVPDAPLPSCDGVDCGAGTCVIGGEQPICTCDVGYTNVDNTCVTCPSEPSYDISIASLRLQGAITIDGKSPPASVIENGRLWLESPSQPDAEERFDLGQTMYGAFEMSVIPGDYTVWYEGLTGGSTVPRNKNAAIGTIAAWQAGDFPIDVPTTVLSGTITINGEPPPNSAIENGDLFLVGASGEEIYIGQTRYGAHETRLIPGTYDLHYRHVAGSSVVPRNEDAVLTTVVVTEKDTTLDIDIAPVEIGGIFQHNSADVPLSDDDYGLVRLRSAIGDQVYLGQTQYGAFEILLLPGTYSIAYEAGPVGTMPANQDVVVGELVVTEAVDDLVIDIPSVLVSVIFSLDGQAPPIGAGEYGAVLLDDPTSADRVYLGTTEGGASTLAVVPGTYDVVFALISGGTQVPRNAYGWVETRTFDAGIGVINVVIDIPTVSLTGSFTIGGSPGNAVKGGGDVYLTVPATSDSIFLGSTADGTYEVLALPGTYQTVYSVTQASEDVPANVGALLQPTVVIDDAVNDIDVPVAGLSGSILLNGEAPPESAIENGRLFLRGPDVGEVPVGETRVGAYNIRLMPGGYDAYFQYLAGGSLMPRNMDHRIGCVVVP